MRYLLPLLVLLALVAGCATLPDSATLVNDKGEKRYCYKVQGGMISNSGAVREFNKCLNEAGSAGFKRVDE
jgi:hypothetical protein